MLAELRLQTEHNLFVPSDLLSILTAQVHSKLAIPLTDAGPFLVHHSCLIDHRHAILLTVHRWSRRISHCPTGRSYFGSSRDRVRLFENFRNRRAEPGGRSEP